MPSEAETYSPSAASRNDRSFIVWSNQERMPSSAKDTANLTTRLDGRNYYVCICQTIIKDRFTFNNQLHSIRIGVTERCTDTACLAASRTFFLFLVVYPLTLRLARCLMLWSWPSSALVLCGGFFYPATWTDIQVLPSRRIPHVLVVENVGLQNRTSQDGPLPPVIRDELLR